MADGPVPRFPPPAPIDAYGNGGFRFAGMSHRGSLLCLPGGIRPWGADQPCRIDSASLQPIFAEADEIDLLVLGSGNSVWMMPAELRARLRELHITVEVLPTAAAVRTYNILLGEGRRVAAALIAVG